MQQQQQQQQRRLQQQLGEWGNLAAVYLLIVVAAVASCLCCLEALEAKQSHKLGRRLFQSKILITAKMLQHSQSALKTETQTHKRCSTQHSLWRLFILFAFDGDIKKPLPGAGAGAAAAAGAGAGAA